MQALCLYSINVLLRQVQTSSNATRIGEGPTRGSIPRAKAKNVGDSRGSVTDLAVLDDIRSYRKNTWMENWYKACIRVQNRVITGRTLPMLCIVLIESDSSFI
jgi:hypothetical protein